jgi:hypothetical protein
MPRTIKVTSTGQQPIQLQGAVQARTSTSTLGMVMITMMGVRPFHSVSVWASAVTPGITDGVIPIIHGIILIMVIILIITVIIRIGIPGTIILITVPGVLLPTQRLITAMNVPCLAIQLPIQEMKELLQIPAINVQ